MLLVLLCLARRSHLKPADGARAVRSMAVASFTTICGNGREQLSQPGRVAERGLPKAGHGSPGGAAPANMRQAIPGQSTTRSIAGLTRSAPDRAWVTDITSVCTQEGFAYLAILIDLFSRRRRLVRAGAADDQRRASGFARSSARMRREHFVRGKSIKEIVGSCKSHGTRGAKCCTPRS